ncbi:type VI secretion system membrane subunit TssM [Pseudomonas izuensis]|uniref:Type VI secretion system membrane subunit TssM n=1 Tax=Pseudomonas izuensis TaxID=2684212 RepID=A0ABM7RZ83_9PSED|nr:type VI secretion system membrane subunit TssM [Pseudomonas izuensis]BCX71244.1 type VI secretion system membrane subunit TssM [Pseudomonas izuensis]
MIKLFRGASALLQKTWLWSLLTVLLVALLVWRVGPLLAVDDYRFWESPTSRLLSISVLFLVWGLTMVFVSWRAGIREQLLESSEDGQASLLRHQQINQERRELRVRFKSALATLRTSSLYRGRRELPWYLLIGPQGSGKTSLLERSGLEFPLNSFDRKLSDGSPGTEYCDWYFAENGVLLETAGRYLTQSNVEVDASGWSSLLGLLQKRHRSRPLNGVMVTLPVQTLSSHDQGTLDTLAKHVRSRLQEVQQRLHVDLPIYLVLSKTDEQSGFHEFFDQLTQEERDQVLGASLSQTSGTSDATAARVEFEALLQRLNSQVIMRMHQERDPLRRSRILEFAHQFGLIGEGLCQFVEKTFPGNHNPRTGQLRGFYFTSAIYSGKPPDHQTDAGAGVRQGDAAVRHTGYSRFIPHLFSRVIFPESGLVELNKRERRRLNWSQRALYVGALATLSLFGFWWAGSFSANHERLDKLRTLAQTWTQQRSATVVGDEWPAVLAPLDTSYAATQLFPEKGEVSFHQRGGLYQGVAANPVIKSAYELELEGHLLPRLATLLEGQIRASMKDRERLLNSLRAYLMLSTQDHRDATWLKERIAAEWSLRYAGNTSMQERLNAHAERLFALPFRYPLNDQLVAQARQILRSESLANVVYRMLREQARNLPEYRLSQHLGPQGALLIGTDHVMPGFYTQQGYQQYFSVRGAALVSDILRDNWVLGEGSDISAMDLRRLMVELEQLYFRDYANAWGNAMDRVALQPTHHAAEGVDQLAGLTSANSPVLQLLVQVREHTRFAVVADGVDEVATAAQAFAEKGGKSGQLVTAAAQKASSVLANNLPDTARKALQRRFEPLHRLLDEHNGPGADLTPVLQALNELQLQLSSLARANAPDQAAYDLAKARMASQRDALSHLRMAAGRLPRPVGAWFSALADDTWRLVLNEAYQYLNQRYQSELYSFYGKAINQRYPFSAHSASDVAISDFREFFKAQGISDRFFDNYLRPFVGGVPGSYRLRSVDGQSLPVSRAYLDQMASAHMIRQSFFVDSSAEPHVQFKLEPYTLDPSVSRSEFRFGDKALEYRHGPIVAASFKWPTDTEDGRTSLVLDRMADRPIGIEKNSGPWSLFRLLDLMQTEYLIGRDVIVLKADLGGLRANYLLTSQRTPNPFDMSVLRTFRMPVQL